MIGVFITSNAQSGSAYTFPRVAGDTLASADSVFKVISITGGYSSLGIQVNLKKLSGTLTGKAFLFTSMDGTTYNLYDSASYVAVPTMAGVTSTTYTHSAQFNKAAPPFVKYLVLATSSATTSTVVQVQYTARK